MTITTFINMFWDKQYSILRNFYVAFVQCNSMIKLLSWANIFLFASIALNNINNNNDHFFNSSAFSDSFLGHETGVKQPP